LSVRRGSLTRLSRAVAFQRRPLSTLIEAQASAGDMFPVTLLVGGRMWVLAAPELAHQVLHGPPALYRAGRANRRILPVLPSDTVLTLDGDDHRRLIDEALAEIDFSPLAGRSTGCWSFLTPSM